MNSRVFGWMLVAILAPAANIAARAQNFLLDRPGGSIVFGGQIDAYSPQTGTTGTMGPYEIHGPWSLTYNRRSGKAEFSAAVNMELSDGWELTTNKNSSTLFDPSARNAHTHNITMAEGEVTTLSTGGFQVTGPAFVTLNGGPTPFAQQSSLTIVIKGGTDVEFSNITLVFGAPASGHFGSDPLTGVVRSVEEEK